MKSLQTALPKIWRWGLLLSLGLALNWIVLCSLTIEEDVAVSIERSRPEAAALFAAMQKTGLFKNSIYIRLTDPAIRPTLLAALPTFGYQEQDLRSKLAPDAATFSIILPFLPAAWLDEALNLQRIPGIVAEVERNLNLPGGLGMVKWLEADPLRLAPLLEQKFSPNGSVGAKAEVLLIERVGALDFAKVEEFYKFLKSHDRSLSFVGGDFFALENRSVVQRDIMLCSLLSLVLGIICFHYCCASWKVLAFLLLGTWFSSSVGLILAQAVDGVIYGLILAFASTFLSFNNETLVHLAGLEKNGSKQRSMRSLVGTASAIGTTFIGFLVLLFSDSHLARQMAILALGSLLGFIAFLSVFRSELKNLAFRSIELRPRPLGRKASFFLVAGLLIAIFILPKPDFKTNLESFRYASPYLTETQRRFEASVQGLNLQSLVALPVKDTEELGRNYEEWQKQGLLQSGAWHPLSLYRDPSAQRAQIEALRPRLEAYRQELLQALAGIGVRLDLPGLQLAETAISTETYLKAWGRISPLPWLIEFEQKTYLMIVAASLADWPKALPLHPRPFYEHLLSELAAQIGGLFLIGLGLMLLYLLPWQRSLEKVALIFLPLLAACLCLQVLFWVSGRDLNIVHIMGAALVIAVALDYSSILVSTEHDAEDQGKVILTGALTLAAFGSLLFATHPLLRELGLIVSVGSGVSWVFALFFRAEGGEFI